MTGAVVEASYVLPTPGTNGANDAGAPSVSDRVAGTVPPAWPGVLVSTTVTPLPPNSSQFRLNRFAPVVPPVTVRKVTNSSCLPAAAVTGTVMVAHVSRPPVEVRFAVATTGPVIESW